MKQSNYTVVRMEEVHVAQIAALEQVCFSDPWIESSVRSELDNPLSYWLVAMDGDHVAAYVGSQTVLDEADIMNVAVAPAYRRQGVARGLLVGLQKALQDMNAYSLTLEVRASNEPAIRLYEKLGFVQIGRRPKYYRNPREDALILRKEWEV